MEDKPQFAAEITAKNVLKSDVSHDEKVNAAKEKQKRVKADHELLERNNQGTSKTGEIIQSLGRGGPMAASPELTQALASQQITSDEIRKQNETGIKDMFAEALVKAILTGDPDKFFLFTSDRNSSFLRKQTKERSSTLLSSIAYSISMVDKELASDGELYEQAVDAALLIFRLMSPNLDLSPEQIASIPDWTSAQLDREAKGEHLPQFVREQLISEGIQFVSLNALGYQTLIAEDRNVFIDYPLNKDGLILEGSEKKTVEEVFTIIMALSATGKSSLGQTPNAQINLSHLREATEKSALLLGRLKDNPQLYQIAERTLIRQLYHLHSGSIPGNILELFSEDAVHYGQEYGEYRSAKPLWQDRLDTLRRFERSNIIQPQEELHIDNVHFPLERRISSLPVDSYMELLNYINTRLRSTKGDLDKGSGTKEDQTLWQHSALVLSRYEDDFEAKLSELIDEPIIDNPLMKVTLALHDIKKGQAFEQTGGTRAQHIFTMKALPSIMAELGFTRRDTEIAASLIDQDFIGELFKFQKPPSIIAREIHEQAERYSMNTAAYLKLLKVFYTCDAGAYTTFTTAVDKDGLPFPPVDSLVPNDALNHVFELGSVDGLTFRDRYQALWDELEEQVNNPEEIAPYERANEEVVMGIGTSLGIGTNLSGARSFLETGRYLTLHDGVRAVQGRSDLPVRVQRENRLGILATGLPGDEDFTIYGAGRLMDPKKFRYLPGNLSRVTIIPEDKVLERISFLVGDSWDTQRLPKTGLTEFRDAVRLYDSYLDYARDRDYMGMGDYVPYLETQLQGGLKPEEVREIILSNRIEDLPGPSYSEELASFLDTTLEQAIPVLFQEQIGLERDLDKEAIKEVLKSDRFPSQRLLDLLKASPYLHDFYRMNPKERLGPGWADRTLEYVTMSALASIGVEDYEDSGISKDLLRLIGAMHGLSAHVSIRNPRISMQFTGHMTLYLMKALGYSSDEISEAIIFIKNKLPGHKLHKLIFEDERVIDKPVEYSGAKEEFPW